MGSDRNIDARFIDGGYADAPTLALTLGLYQTRENGDIDTDWLNFSKSITTNSDILASKTQTIEGLTITTALMSIPTIENPVFKTKAGQKVEVLPIVLNSKVPTVVIGKEQIQKQTGPLAEMASRDIFSNQEL
ncbi:hypothetical protein FRACYDRAFT_250263 [Fragilariopsis cylindrus CCMP1102]|uniref:Uncharacterized protein n=1 Tax=Fragilariopsis cylindrus CCMP1102 TaxID=635003 RepID=A0A1E7EQ33_9STRA|nr:hypothetical protein FRACYDRAFT_250263 [Fragilariopsis cylindrus CCMP1102]|eukprot:OEU08041.1 hypothetical protein FRACYDRAFT_250263 [Fragilariopsis cylindrus CCMP1102]